MKVNIGEKKFLASRLKSKTSYVLLGFSIKAKANFIDSVSVFRPVFDVNLFSNS